MNMHSKNVRAICRSVVSAVVALLCIETGYASSWYKGELQLKEDNPSVSVVMMRWGTPKSTGVSDYDIVVGQIVAAGYRAVTLVFEGIGADGKKFLMTFNDVPVQRYINDPDDLGSLCTSCSEGIKENKKGVMAKGFFVGKGCYFQAKMPRDPSLKKLRLIDVKSGDTSLYYFIKFNVSLDLVRSGLAVPIAQNITIHDIPSPVKEFVPESKPSTTNTAPRQAPPKQTSQSAVSQTSRLPQDAATN